MGKRNKITSEVDRYETADKLLTLVDSFESSASHQKTRGRVRTILKEVANTNFLLPMELHRMGISQEQIHKARGNKSPSLSKEAREALFTTIRLEAALEMNA